MTQTNEQFATGIIRRIDDLGRLVIPKEIRRNLAIQEGDPLEIIPQTGGVFVRPYRGHIENRNRLVQRLSDLYRISCKHLGFTASLTVFDKHAHRLAGRLTGQFANTDDLMCQKFLESNALRTETNTCVWLKFWPAGLSTDDELVICACAEFPADKKEQALTVLRVCQDTYNTDNNIQS